MVKNIRADHKPASPEAGYLEMLEQVNRQCNGNALLRLWQIIGDKKKGIPALIPVCKTVFWERVKSGLYPQPVRFLGKRTTAWYYKDIMALIENTGAKETGGNNEKSH